MMKNWQASCDDGWKSTVVNAEDKMAAAALLVPQMGAHVKEKHLEMPWPADMLAQEQATAEHTAEVLATPAM